MNALLIQENEVENQLKYLYKYLLFQFTKSDSTIRSEHTKLNNFHFVFGQCLLLLKISIKVGEILN